MTTERQQPERQSETPVWDEASLEHVHQVPDKARRVQAMFDAIVPRYELVNTLTTLGLDGTWRRRLVQALELPQGARVLDIACGTGQVVRAFRKYRHEVAELLGLDFSGEMVREAKRLDGEQADPETRRPGDMEQQREETGDRGQGTADKEQHLIGGQAASGTLASGSCPSGISTASRRDDTAVPSSGRGTRAGTYYLQGDALHLPLAGNRFDAVTCVFGVRNFADPAAGLVEMFRVLRPGGMLGILEFSMPRVAVLAGLYKVYFRLVLPRLASLLSGNRGGAYRYLQKSVEAFSQEVDLQGRLGQCGFERVRARLLTFGVVTLYTACKP